MKRALTGLLVLTGLLAGCTNKIKGEIEDQQIKPKSAFYFGQAQVLGTDGLLGIILTDVPNGCDVYTGYLASAAGQPDAAGQASAWTAAFPPDFWELAFVLRVPDPNAATTGQVFSGVAWDKTLEQASQYQGAITHHVATRDEAFYDGTGDLGAYQVYYGTNGGTMEIKDHEPGASISGRIATFTVALGSDDPTGLIEIGFNAEYCAGANLLSTAGQAVPAE